MFVFLDIPSVPQIAHKSNVEQLSYRTSLIHRCIKLVLVKFFQRREKGIKNGSETFIDHYSCSIYQMYKIVTTTSKLLLLTVEILLSLPLLNNRVNFWSLCIIELVYTKHEHIVIRGLAYCDEQQ